MKKVLWLLSITLAFLLVSNIAYSQNMNSDSATLIVYRDGFLYGGLTNFDIKIDGDKMGELDKNKSMQPLMLDSGSHMISPGNEDNPLIINMDSGKTYVVEYKVRFGILGAVPKLDIKTVSEGKDDSKMVSNYFNNEMM